jgi:hypothetical protein
LRSDQEKSDKIIFRTVSPTVGTSTYTRRGSENLDIFNSVKVTQGDSPFCLERIPLPDKQHATLKFQ